MSLWRYLLTGSDDLTLPKDWLADTARLRSYEGYTRRQLHQGAVVSDVETMRRRDFWAGVEAKRRRVLPANVREMRRSER